MDRWPTEKKQRIIEIVRNLDLPPGGEALDFGCGNGELTETIREALPPGWKVFGTDVSTIAVKNAHNRYSSCTFFVAGDNKYPDKKYDFLFTHHVLEHVHNLGQALDEMDAYLKASSAMLHILPCGNEGSLEHRICLLRRDGIDPRLENRFFFEDEGHLRRLTTEQLSSLCARKGFALAKEYYSSQNAGAIEWITQRGPNFVNMFTDTSQALDMRAESSLRKLRRKLLALSVLRYPAAVVERIWFRKNRALRHYAFLVAAIPFYLFSKPIDIWLKAKALEEWKSQKTKRNGSEMYLFFKR
jgi:ubiquinone/menaquinone biosynthesis C-methylase UbiE